VPMHWLPDDQLTPLIKVRDAVSKNKPQSSPRSAKHWPASMGPCPRATIQSFPQRSGQCG